MKKQHSQSSIHQSTNSPIHQFSQVLLVRLREIGDVVFTTPAIRALRERYRDAHITYLVEPHAAPIVWNNPHLSEVLVAPRVKGWLGLWSDVALGRSLRARGFDLAIDFHGGPRASFLTWLSGARERVGYNVIGRSWMYTRRVGRPRTLRARHSVENQWDLLEAIGIPPPDRAHHPVEMPLEAAAVETVTARLQSAGVDDTDPLVVIHVSAGNPFRRWPLEHFVALTTALARETDARIALTSGPSESDAAARVLSDARDALPQEARARILACGEFSLAELRALCERAAVYVGGDSGPLHVASTSHVPIVGLYGPTLPERSAPWRDPAIATVSVDGGPLPCRPCDQRVCVPGDFRCLRSIPPERVAGAAIRLFSGAVPPPPSDDV